MESQPWFEFDDYRSRRCYLDLSLTLRERVDRFRRDGYLIVNDMSLDDKTIDQVIGGLRGKYHHSATGYSSGGRIQDAWKENSAVGRIAVLPDVLDLLKVLYQREPIPFQTLNFDRGTEHAAHSDTIHFNSLPFGFMCGVWVALEDVDAENGPLVYYTGNQRLPVFYMHELGLQSQASEYPKYEKAIERILAESSYKPQQAHLKKGQMLIWSANVFHGGAKILNPVRTRLSQVTHYYFPGCIYYTPMLSDIPNQSWMLRQVKDIRTQETKPDYLGAIEQRKRNSIRADVCWRTSRRGPAEQMFNRRKRLRLQS